MFLNQARKFVSRLMVTVVVVLLIAGAYFFLIGTVDDVAELPPENSDAQTVVVDYVVDGDTLDLTIDGVTERVRLIGVDTPETVNRQTPKQCYGEEASVALRELLPEGSQVRVERDAEARDRYDRLLLYVYRSNDELFINQWMVENGFASATSYRPNVTFEGVFSKAEREARSNNVGLWAACDGPDQPLDPGTS